MYILQGASPAVLIIHTCVECIIRASLEGWLNYIAGQISLHFLLTQPENTTGSVAMGSRNCRRYLTDTAPSFYCMWRSLAQPAPDVFYLNARSITWVWWTSYVQVVSTRRRFLGVLTAAVNWRQKEGKIVMQSSLLLPNLLQFLAKCNWQ